ncbi:MAG: hypothetical protein ABIK48_05845 [candidate division WOR-3 bacterium]
MENRSFLRKLTAVPGLPAEFCNPLKFASQFWQSAFILEEYLTAHFGPPAAALKMLDLFAGIGTYAIYFARHYKNYFSKIVATEKDPRTYDYLVERIKSFGLRNLIIPCKVDANAGFNPYLCPRLTLHKQTFDILLANPPYVPLPPGSGLVFNFGGPLGISAVFQFFKHLSQYSRPANAMFGLLAYSLGDSQPGRRGIINGTMNPEFIKNTAMRREYLSYKKMLRSLSNKYTLRYFVLLPPAWSGYSIDYADEPTILLDDYYRLLPQNLYNTRELLQFCKNFSRKYRFLTNLLIVGINKGKIQNRRAFLIKNIGPEYLNSVLKLEKICWPKQLQASRDNLASRLQNFSAGCVGAFNLDGTMVGFATSQRIKFKPTGELRQLAMARWMELDNYPDADISRTSDPRGNALHLVSACVMQKYRQQGLWQDMLIYRLKLAKLLNLDYAVILTRLAPKERRIFTRQELINYILHAPDPYLRTLRKYGFVPDGFIYKESDSESGGYWVCLYRKLKPEK